MHNTTSSRDNELCSLIDALKQQASAYNLADINTIDQTLSYAALLSAIYVGEALLKQSALLLPDVYDSFHDKVLHIIRLRDIACDGLEVKGMVTCNWLRSQLSSLLNHHMAYRCCVKKYGTVLYRHGGDLVHALNVCLGQARSQNHPSDYRDEVPTAENIDFQQKLLECCLVLNSKIHACIDSMIEQDMYQPHSIEDININQFIGNLDPDVWKAVCILTQPIKGADMSNIRKVRCFVCVCVLLYTTNSQCSFPLHTFLTDAIETCGGSSRLIKLLNRLGICTSVDTHARYVQYRVKRSVERGVMKDYPQDAFTLVSADNLDFIHSHARVYCGKQQSSWHGTTVQVVQPQPTRLVDTCTPSRLTESHAETTTNSETCTQCEPHSSASAPIEVRLSKRLHSSRSPLSKSCSPSKRSPIPKRMRRMRTGIEQATCRNLLHELAPLDSISRENIIPSQQSPHQQPPVIEDFHLTSTETKAVEDVKKLSLQYILQKVANRTSSEVLIDFHTCYSLYNNLPSPECSNIVYFKVLDQRCDSKETLVNVISDIHAEFIVSRRKKWVLLEGDQDTYNRLQVIKTEYGNDLSWMIPIPGDWHFLKNYQEVLLKVYFDAGLSDLAKASGYQPNSIGSNFKRTHHFLLETWESLYRHFLSLFLSQKAPPGFLDFVSEWIKSFPPSEDQQGSLRNFKQMLDDISEEYPDFEPDFLKFNEEQSSRNQTWKFWSEYLFHDCSAYITLHLVIRSSNWNLRLAAIKSMAALFTAFDRNNYQKLIAQHIVDILTIPQEVLDLLCNGGFTVSITGRPCHSIGIDEAHEMCINRDCKEFITKPSAEYINRVANFLPVRAKAMKNIESQIFPERNQKSDHQLIKTIYTTDVGTKKLDMNIQKQVEKLEQNCCLTVESEDNSLHHLFNSIKPAPEQIQDLMNFRKVGQTEFDRRVQYYTLSNPSVRPPKRRKRLLTFTERKSRKKKVSEIERERKIQIECWKKRVAFASSTGTQLSHAYEQCIELPRALATCDGRPNKGSKANTTTVYAKRYESTTPSIITTSFPTGWVPSTVVIEGMFLINISPWSAHTNMGDYAHFLIKQHILPHFRNGTTEVHLLFDHPECQAHSPKYFERKHRDSSNPVPADHYCDNFTTDMLIPTKWRQNVLGCRKCKRDLVCFLSHHLVHHIGQYLRPPQRFVTAGGFDGTLQNQAMFTEFNAHPQPDSRLVCNAEETDYRIWLHVLNSAGEKKLVLSPDTDVYHIGLPQIVGTNLDVIVRLNQFNCKELRVLHMQHLITAFTNDPDLATIPEALIPLAMQAVYVCTGCDFISFFHGFGKASFLSALFEYGDFICCNSEEAPGTVADIESESALLSFFRLVGCTYFRKHKPVFLPSYPMPATIFNSLYKDHQTPLTHHRIWLQFIRERVWSRIKYEEEMIPSADALERHWKRSCWVLAIWRQANRNNIEYPPLDMYGWKLTDTDTLLIDWDSEENMTEVRTRVALIRKGCGCKTGCMTARCKCRKSGNHCGPGCTCLGCCNVEASTTQDVMDIELAETLHHESDVSDLEGEVDEIMQNVFGDYECADLDYCSSNELTVMMTDDEELDGDSDM